MRRWHEVFSAAAPTCRPTTRAARPFIAGDPWRRRGLRYAVHTATEAVTDICYHVSAKRLNRAPSTPHEALDALVEARILPGERAAAWHRMFRLRNVLVYGYEVVSDVQLVSDVRAGLGDLEAFATAITPLAAEPGT
jgi:uncharacterized protein YutE (UPF0331/DUF86 family)